MKRQAPRAALVLFLGALLALQPAGVPGAGATASPCSSEVAVLGADIPAADRAAIERALGVGVPTVRLTETLADERNQARGLIPPALLGASAVSSVLLRLLPAGSGLTVTLNTSIRDTPQSYANALLTAGVTDAEVRVAAPPALAANVYGTTALLGLFRAAQVSCHALNPIRVGLALQEVVLTTELAGATGVGRAAAPRLMFTLKNDAVSRHISTLPSLHALVAYDSALQNIAVPAALLLSLDTFLHGLVVSNAYAAVLRRKPHVTVAAPLQLHMAIAAPPASGRPTARATPTARPSTSRETPVPRTVTPAPAPSSRAGIWYGTVASARASDVTVREQDGMHDYPAARGVQVYRNGVPGSLSTLQSGDAITMTTNAVGEATTIIATGPATGGVARAAPGGGNGNTDGALTIGTSAVLVALVLLALLLVPVVAGALRRRRRNRRVLAGRRR